MFSWIIESRGIQAWSFCNRVLCASGIQLDVGANRWLVVGYNYSAEDAVQLLRE